MGKFQAVRDDLPMATEPVGFTLHVRMVGLHPSGGTEVTGTVEQGAVAVGDRLRVVQDGLDPRPDFVCDEIDYSPALPARLRGRPGWIGLTLRGLDPTALQVGCKIVSGVG
jgi:hypothetical protein